MFMESLRSSALTRKVSSLTSSGIRGSLTFDSDQALAAIAIRESRNGHDEPLYATLPVADLLATAGTAPLTYQWRRNGTDLPGATAATYTTPATTAADTAAQTAEGQVRHFEQIRRARLRVAEKITDLIGDTPIVRLHRFERDVPGVEIWAKCEFMNPGGSVKDRAAYQMIRDAIRAKTLVPGKTIIDSTSGNTGVA